jgi:hypothetical protein
VLSHSEIIMYCRNLLHILDELTENLENVLDYDMRTMSIDYIFMRLFIIRKDIRCSDFRGEKLVNLITAPFIIMGSNKIKNELTYLQYLNFEHIYRENNSKILKLEEKVLYLKNLLRAAIKFQHCLLTEIKALFNINDTHVNAILFSEMGKSYKIDEFLAYELGTIFDLITSHLY